MATAIRVGHRTEVRSYRSVEAGIPEVSVANHRVVPSVHIAMTVATMFSRSAISASRARRAAATYDTASHHVRSCEHRDHDQPSHRHPLVSATSPRLLKRPNSAQLVTSAPS